MPEKYVERALCRKEALHLTHKVPPFIIWLGKNALIRMTELLFFEQQTEFAGMLLVIEMGCGGKTVHPKTFDTLAHPNKLTLRHIALLFPPFLT